MRQKLRNACQCKVVYSSQLPWLQAEILNPQASNVGGAKRFFETEGYDPRTSNVLRMLGYFSLVGLSRVHALIGDFHTSLQALHPINPFLKKYLYTSKIAGESPAAKTNDHR